MHPRRHSRSPHHQCGNVRGSCSQPLVPRVWRRLGPQHRVEQVHPRRQQRATSLERRRAGSEAAESAGPAFGGRAGPSSAGSTAVGTGCSVGRTGRRREGRARPRAAAEGPGSRSRVLPVRWHRSACVVGAWVVPATVAFAMRSSPLKLPTPSSRPTTLDFDQNQRSRGLTRNVMVAACARSEIETEIHSKTRR